MNNLSFVLRPIGLLLVGLLFSACSDASETAEAEVSVALLGQSDRDVQVHDNESQMEVATFGAGCFWCVEAVFLRIDGVESVVSGYMGGTLPDPTYQQIITGRTGHAEVVQLKYDPATIGYDDLLSLFWVMHNPTTLNRQGADVGTQYRSAIFYHSDSQKEIAERSRAEAFEKFVDPIVTEIVEASIFYEAEEYHQDYFAKNPQAAYCQLVIVPKLRELGLED